MVTSSDIKAIPAHDIRRFGTGKNGARAVSVAASPYGEFVVYFGHLHGSEFAISHSQHSREFRTAAGAARAASAWLA
jgi:hypothetical protein